MKWASLRRPQELEPHQRSRPLLWKRQRLCWPELVSRLMVFRRTKHCQQKTLDSSGFKAMDLYWPERRRPHAVWFGPWKEKDFHIDTLLIYRRCRHSPPSQLSAHRQKLQRRALLWTWVRRPSTNTRLWDVMEAVTPRSQPWQLRMVAGAVTREGDKLQCRWTVRLCWRAGQSLVVAKRMVSQILEPAQTAFTPYFPSSSALAVITPFHSSSDGSKAPPLKTVKAATSMNYVTNYASIGLKLTSNKLERVSVCYAYSPTEFYIQ